MHLFREACLEAYSNAKKKDKHASKNIKSHGVSAYVHMTRDTPFSLYAALHILDDASSPSVS